MTIALTDLIQLNEFSKCRQDDADDGSDVDEADEEGHDELADGLLVAGDAALAGDARPDGSDRKGEGDDQELKNWARVQFEGSDRIHFEKI
jgi:hypothetical protein